MIRAASRESRRSSPSDMDSLLICSTSGSPSQASPVSGSIAGAAAAAAAAVTGAASAVVDAAKAATSSSQEQKITPFDVQGGVDADGKELGM